MIQGLCLKAAKVRETWNKGTHGRSLQNADREGERSVSGGTAGSSVPDPVVRIQMLSRLFEEMGNKLLGVQKRAVEEVYWDRPRKEVVLSEGSFEKCAL